MKMDRLDPRTVLMHVNTAKLLLVNCSKNKRDPILENAYEACQYRLQ